MIRELFVVGTLGSSVAVAVAQVPADNPLKPHETRSVAEHYADCVVHLSPDVARKYVVTPGQPDPEAKPPINGNCLNTVMSASRSVMMFPGQTYRYALAEALLRYDYPVALPAGVAASPPLLHAQPAMDTAPAKDPKKAEAALERLHRNQGFWALDIVGECVVRANPEGTFALTRTSVDSDSETAALEAIKPAISGCLSADSSVRLRRMTLRGTIAANLFRLAYEVAPRSGAKRPATRAAAAPESVSHANS